MELEAARAEAARLGEAVRELAVKLVLVEGQEVLGQKRRPSDAVYRCSLADQQLQPSLVGPRPM